MKSCPRNEWGHNTRIKSVWETRFIQILRLPSWLKNSFKDGASKEKKFKNAQNQKYFFWYSKTCYYPYFLQAIFFPKHHIKNMNFLSFCLRLGSRRFVLKHHVIKNIFENKVGIGYMYANKQLLTPKKDMDYYRLFSRKLVWFGIFWVSHPKIDLWGIFPTQFLP